MESKKGDPTWRGKDVYAWLRQHGWSPVEDGMVKDDRFIHVSAIKMARDDPETDGVRLEACSAEIDLERRVTSKFDLIRARVAEIDAEVKYFMHCCKHEALYYTGKGPNHVKLNEWKEKIHALLEEYVSLIGKGESDETDS